MQGLKGTTPMCVKHPNRRARALGLCGACYMVQWMRKHPAANSGNNWSRTHPERAKVNMRRANWKQRGHACTIEQYEAMWVAQRGKCANPACGNGSPLDVADYRRGALQVDHDHQSGAIRGLLCPGCNRTLGLVEDDAERLQGLVSYLADRPGFGLN